MKRLMMRCRALAAALAVVSFGGCGVQDPVESFNEAVELAKKGKWDAAASRVEKIIEVDSKNKDYRIFQVICQMQLKQFDKASAELAELSTDSKDPVIQFLRGKLYFLQKDYTEASKMLSKAYQNGIERVDANEGTNYKGECLALYVHCALELNVPNLPSFLGLLDSAPVYNEDPTLLNNIGCWFLNQNEFTKARLYFAKAYQNAKKAGEAEAVYILLNRAVASESERKDQIALSLYNECLKDMNLDEPLRSQIDKRVRFLKQKLGL